MVSKEEIKIKNHFQFYDKHRALSFERKRIDITLPMEMIIKLKEKGNVSKRIEQALRDTNKWKKK